MKRPVFLGIMGGPKEGKTHLAATMFTSQYLDPERVIHFDNHGSTDAFDLHQWTQAEPWGVRHIPSDHPEKLLEYLKDIKRKALVRPPYDGIIIDDVSEYAQMDIEDRMAEHSEEKEAMRNWRDHGDVMRETGRIIHPARIKADVLCLFQAAQLPDPLEEKPKTRKDNKLVYTADSRDTMIRPFLQGAFAAWFPYKLDALFYAHMKVKKGGGYQFFLQMAKSDKVDVLTRWLAPWVEDPRRNINMEDPTWDRIVEFIKTQTKEEA